MKKLLFVLLNALLLCGVASAQIGKNLASNGDFRSQAGTAIHYWETRYQPYATPMLSGGPDNMPYMQLRQGNDDSYENQMRMRGLIMVPGERYRISAQIRTKGFSAKRGELLLVSSPWYKETGIKKFPANTNGWQKIEMDIVCPEKDKDGIFDICVLVIGQRGLLDIADIRLEPLTEIAAAQSKSPQESFQGVCRLVPWGVSFDEVAIANPQITFMWYGRLGADFRMEDYAFEAVAEGFASPRASFEIGKPFTLKLTGIPAGHHSLNVRMVKKSDGTVGYEEKFLVNVRDIPREDEVTKGRRLNNFTVELCNRKLAPGEIFTFVLAHDAWMYFTLNGTSAAEFAIDLDGKHIAADPLTGLPECFRLVSAGRHAVSAPKGGQLVARTISELFSCGMNQGPDYDCFKPYDWEYAKKNALYAVTTLNRGSYVKNGRELVDAAHASGRIWLEDMYVVNCKDAADMQQFIETRMKRLDFRDGNTTNEIYSVSLINRYVPALKKCDYDHSKLIYTWAGGAPSSPELYHDYFGAALNAGGGRGKILYEFYYFTQPTEDDAKQYIHSMAYNIMHASIDFYPDFIRRAGFILGNFNQIGVISEEHHPQTDYKYYLDMQMNMLANDPMFEGLGTVGYWGTHYADEELYRWSHKLLRHYVVEGRKDMLSPRYGFSYIPGHIVNNDFDDGLKGWTAKPAEEGSISTATYKNFANFVQCRYSVPEGVGDNFCTFKVIEGKPNTLSQVAKNLVPGKKYILLFTVGDYDDTKAKRQNPRRFGINATISDAEILPESFVFVDSRKNGKYTRNNGMSRQNLHRILFVPKKSEATITFSDAEAKPGETLLFNYIQVKPFFDAE